MKTIARWFVSLLGVAVLFVSGCATNPVSKRSEFVLMSEEQELALGRQMHAEVLKEYRDYKDPKLQQYVQRIGEQVAANSDRPQLIYRFTVLDSPEVNAFALPGGYIYVTRGIMAYMNSEAELAAVIGHEIGHVTARHAVRQYTASRPKSRLSFSPNCAPLAAISWSTSSALPFCAVTAVNMNWRRTRLAPNTWLKTATIRRPC